MKRGGGGGIKLIVPCHKKKKKSAHTGLLLLIDAIASDPSSGHKRAMIKLQSFSGGGFYHARVIYARGRQLVSHGMGGKLKDYLPLF